MVLPTVERVFVFLTDGRNKNPFKALESIGKDILAGALNVLVEKDVVKLEKTDKEKFNDAKPGDKFHILMNAVEHKRIEPGQVLVQTFINTNRNAITEGKNRGIYNQYLKLSGIRLFPMSLLCPL